jgi:GNAT superfamily N-acetyltransferase
MPSQQLAVVARLLVSPTHRRKGVAQALLAAALAEANRLDRTPILDVATHFEKAISLYETCGWRRLGQVAVEIAGVEPLEEYVYAAPPV